MNVRSSLLAVPFLLLAAACSSTTAAPGFEAALPVRPGQTWDQARAALERLDPGAREVEGVGGRTTVARTPVTVAGIRFDQVSIAGVASRPQVRSVSCPRRRRPAAATASGTTWCTRSGQGGAPASRASGR